MSTVSATPIAAKVIVAPEMLMNVNLADAEFNKMLQGQSAKLLATYGYKLIAKFASHYSLDFEEMCEVAGLKKRKAPKKEKVSGEIKIKPELTEEEKAAKKAALIARLAEGRAKKAAEKAAAIANGEIEAEKPKKEKPELTEEEKAAKKTAIAEKRKATIAAKKQAVSSASSSESESENVKVQLKKSKQPKPELSDEEKEEKKKAAIEKRKASIAAKKKADFDAKVKAAIAAKIAELSSASGSEVCESD